MSKSHNKSIFDVIGRHAVHPFPARMAPGIVLDLLQNTGDLLRVLDPMMGSGTVIATARSQGHRAFGYDMDPLAVLISKVWTTALDGDDVRAKARGVLGRAKSMYATTSADSAFPRGADEETRRFLMYWFDGYARRELLCLASSIRSIRDERARNALWCGFSRLIISKQAGASLAMDLAHSRPHKVFARSPIRPFEKFLTSVDRVVDNCIESTETNRGPNPKITNGDARAMSLSDTSIDLIITSPPYLNAIDYFRCSKFSLVWMRYKIGELRRLRSRSIGSEVGLKEESERHTVRQILKRLRLRPKLADRSEAILIRYICDMRSVIRESARVLVPGGRAIYVMGENTIRGTYVRNSAIIEELAEAAGLTICHRQTRQLPSDSRYLPPPSAKPTAASFDLRMRREVILTFEKSCG